MAFAPYVRLVMGGTIDSTQTWSMGLSCLTAGAVSSSDLFTWLPAMDTAVKAFLNTTGVKSVWWTSSTVYNSLRAYHYSSPGPADAQAQLISTGVVGTGSSDLPRQLATVISLRTGNGSRADRGRVYMPCTAASAISTIGQHSSSGCTTLGGAFELLVHAINASSLAGSPPIVSIAGRDSGAHAVVQNVIVNSKVDTQRRRTDKIGALFSVSTPVT